ncbi:MAG: glycosyltransferase family 39 protein [Terriglobales bacterium]
MPLLCLTGGFLVRLVPARLTFLNPDEVLHYFLSREPSLRATYQASLTTAHPPLLILLLHYWQLFGHSELFLRLPSLLAGLAFAWMMFLWLRRIADRSTAITGLVLLLFSPALISVSSEVRQYALLLCFAAISLYLLDRAIEENSAAMMLLSSGALYLALLVHYSSLIFAFTLGVYTLWRLRATRSNTKVVAVWVAGQVVALALSAFLYKTHLATLQHSVLRQEIADTWLRNSIFHPGQGQVALFVVSRTVRLFRYLFSNGTIGVLALMVFIYGIGFLLLNPEPHPPDRKPAPRQLALLFALPFLLTAAAAVTGLYPYGGTRHDIFLAAFAMSGVSFGLARLKIPQEWLLLAVLSIALAIGNLIPFPTPPYIKPENQDRRLMNAAMAWLHREALPGSVLLTDYEGGLMLSYYPCHDRVIEIKTTHAFLHSSCGDYRVVASSPDLWSYDPRTLPAGLQELQLESKAGGETTVLLFQAGWIDDRQAEWITQLSQLGCRNPQLFGQNIFFCRIK